jgi:hypothetical protein
MMWLGRINFFVDKTDIEQSKKLTPSIILLTGIMKNNQGMLLKWRGLTEPINYIVGKTDYIPRSMGGITT